MMVVSRFLVPVLLSGSILVAGCDREEVLQGRIDRTVSESTTPQIVALIVPPSFSQRPDNNDAAPSDSVVDDGGAKGTDLADLDTTTGESNLLQHAGAHSAEPGIRDTLDAENSVLSGEPDLVEALLFGDWPTTPPTPELFEDIPEDPPADDGSFWDWF